MHDVMLFFALTMRHLVCWFPVKSLKLLHDVSDFKAKMHHFQFQIGGVWTCDRGEGMGYWVGMVGKGFDPYSEIINTPLW